MSTEIAADAPPPNPEIVPGMMRCAKCGFVLNRITLYVKTGTAGAGDNRTEPCPNGCGPLWPQTWRDQAHQLEDRLVQMYEELKRAHTMIAQLYRAGVLSSPHCCQALGMTRQEFLIMCDWRAPL